MEPPGPVEPQPMPVSTTASPKTPVRVALLTASDTRTAASNEGGRVLRKLLEEARFSVIEEALLAEEPTALREWVATRARRGTADAIVVTGGTGIAPRDRTPEAIAGLFERRLPGFGELFRMLSFEQIGAPAMLSRADAGVVGQALVFLLPGSPAAVELAVRRLLAPGLAHAVAELRRAADPHDDSHRGHPHGR